MFSPAKSVGNRTPKIPVLGFEAGLGQLRVDLVSGRAFTAGMQRLLILLAIIVLAVPGCTRSRRSQPKPAPISNGPAPHQGPILTPETALRGRVVRVNPSGRFVILNFPVGHLPSLEQRLGVYRLGLKIGEIKVTGPQYDDNIVGDLIAGEVQPGDEVRDR
jgi:hypothetical protein